MKQGSLLKEQSRPVLFVLEKLFEYLFFTQFSLCHLIVGAYCGGVKQKQQDLNIWRDKLLPAGSQLRIVHRGVFDV